MTWSLSYFVIFQMYTCYKDLLYTSNFASTMFLQTLAMDLFIWMPFLNLDVSKDSCQCFWYFMVFNCSPWTGTPYEDATEKNAFGGLSLDAFLSEVHKSSIFVSIPFLAFCWIMSVKEWWVLLGVLSPN